LENLGYVLSKEAVQRFVHQVKNGPTDICHSASDGGAEDINIGIIISFLSSKFTHEYSNFQANHITKYVLKISRFLMNMIKNYEYNKICALL
jgi:hypothetical protein